MNLRKLLSVFFISLFIFGCEDENSKACKVVECKTPNQSPDSPTYETPPGTQKTFLTTHGSYSVESLRVGIKSKEYGNIFGVRSWGGNVFLYLREKVGSYIYQIVIVEIDTKGVILKEHCRFIDDNNFKKGFWVDGDYFYLAENYSSGTFRRFNKFTCREISDLRFGLWRTGSYYSTSNEVVQDDDGHYLWLRGRHLVELSSGFSLLKEYQPQKIGTRVLDWRSVDAIDLVGSTLWASDGWALWQLDRDGVAKAWGAVPKDDYKHFSDVNFLTALDEKRLLIVSRDYSGEYGFFVLNTEKFKTW